MIKEILLAGVHGYLYLVILRVFEQGLHERGISRYLIADTGFHVVMARIEASGTASRALHESCGYTLVGIEREIGRKFGKWLDVALMQCVLHERS